MQERLGRLVRQEHLDRLELQVWPERQDLVALLVLLVRQVRVVVQPGRLVPREQLDPLEVRPERLDRQDQLGRELLERRVLLGQLDRLE